MLPETHHEAAESGHSGLCATHGRLSEDIQDLRDEDEPHLPGSARCVCMKIVAVRKCSVHVHVCARVHCLPRCSSCMGLTVQTFMFAMLCYFRRTFCTAVGFLDSKVSPSPSVDKEDSGGEEGGGLKNTEWRNRNLSQSRSRSFGGGGSIASMSSSGSLSGLPQPQVCACESVFHVRMQSGISLWAPEPRVCMCVCVYVGERP